MTNELCGVILIDKHKGVTSHDYSLPCVKGGGPRSGGRIGAALRRIFPNRLRAVGRH